MPVDIGFVRDRRFFPAVACGLGAALIWGAWPVGTRLGVAHAVSPFDVTALRFGVSGLILLPIVLRRGTGQVGRRGALLLAMGAGAPYVLVSAAGLTFAPAGHAGVIIPSCMMMFSTLGGALLLRDKPDAQRIIGIGAILAGVFMIGWEGFDAAHESAWIGDALFVGSGLLWATYTVASRYFQADALHATALVSVVSMLLYLPLYVVMGWSGLAAAPAGAVLFQAAFQGILVGIGALLLYTKTVQILGAGRGAIFATLVPALAVLLAVPVLAEKPTWLEWTGVAVVTLGMVYALALPAGRWSR